MKITIDTTTQSLDVTESGVSRTIPLYSDEAFELLSQTWVKVGWNQKHNYTFSWLGRPIIQLPEDIVRIQEVIYQIKPDVIIETGIAHGGSLIFYASLCKVLGRGRIVGIDIEIRPHNRKAIESHELYPYLTLVEGSATDLATVEKVKALVKPGETVLVLLDSCHTKEHVAKELEAYAPLVSVGSYIIATDGIMKDLYDVPRGHPDWKWDHPTASAAEFAEKHPEFALEQPRWPFNESTLKTNISHWPGAYLRKIQQA